jgi:hypothetical protein
MPAIVSYFPVGNGDMTLVRLADSDETSLLIDVNIRCAADDPDDDTRDVGADLRKRLKRDSKNRAYVDGFLLSHPDKDHCAGLSKHFYLGKPEDYPDDDKPDDEKKIFIRQIWSSPLIFRRASKEHTLCDDAAAFNTEAKRRVRVNRDKKFQDVAEGDRILILGEDKDGKTNDLTKILVKTGDTFTGINDRAREYLETQLLAPRLQQSQEDEELLSKNHSSVIVNLKIAASAAQPDGCKFLTGGDAEVEIWERLWKRYKGNPVPLEYDMLQTPHHCSWHTLSRDSWSELREKGVVSRSARSALSQTRGSASIVASSKEILDDDNDPPCIGAKREYEDILKSGGGAFYSTGEYPKASTPEPLEFEITAKGPSKLVRAGSISVIASAPAPRAGGAE